MSEVGTPTSSLLLSTAKTNTANAVPLGDVALEQLPTRLAQLTRAIILSGTVVGQTSNGATRLRTQAGEITFRSSTPVTSDTPVTLQISPGQPPVSAKAFTFPSPSTPSSPLSKPIPDASRVPSQTPTSPSPSVVKDEPNLPLIQSPPIRPPTPPPTERTLPTPPPTPTPTLTPTPSPTKPTDYSAASTIQPQTDRSPSNPIETVTPEASNPTPQEPEKTPAPKATASKQIETATHRQPEVTEPKSTEIIRPPPVRTASLPIPAGTILPAQVITRPSTPPAPPKDIPDDPDALSTPEPATPEPATPEPATPEPGETVAVRVLGQAETEPDFSPHRPSGPVMTGTVLGAGTGGRTLLATRLGTLALATRTPLPPGLALAIEMLDPRTVTLSMLQNPTASPLSAPGLPSLGEVLINLGGLSHPLARHLLNTVPQPNHRLAAALTFFLDRARRGDARGWLGEEVVNALERSEHKEALEHMDNAFRAMSHEAASPTTDGWSPFPVPMFDGSAIQRLNVYVRPIQGDGQDDAGENGKSGRKGRERGCRFVVDIDFSRLGPLQLDGLVRPQRFDLMLRSRNPLPDPLRQEIQAAFGRNLDAVGFSGALGFQTGSRGWVRPTPNAAQPLRGILA